MKLRIRLQEVCIMVALVMVIAYLILSNSVRNLKADRDLVIEECNNIQEQLNLSEQDVTVLKQQRITMNNELAKLELGIKIMEDEVQVVKNELAEYKYRELWYRDIDLDDEYQIYIYEWCKKLQLDYDIALAKIQLESRFDVNARGYNKNDQGQITSTDYGLCQINSGNLNWCNELAGREVDVVNDVYDNIECALRIYKSYQDYWNDKGYTGYELNIRTLNSYNLGISGFSKYIENGNSWDSWRYAKLVYNNLENIR